MGFPLKSPNFPWKYWKSSPSSPVKKGKILMLGFHTTNQKADHLPAGAAVWTLAQQVDHAKAFSESTEFAAHLSIACWLCAEKMFSTPFDGRNQEILTDPITIQKELYGIVYLNKKKLQENWMNMSFILKRPSFNVWGKGIALAH